MHPKDPLIEKLGPLLLKVLAAVGGGTILGPVILALATPFLASH